MGPLSHTQELALAPLGLGDSQSARAGGRNQGSPGGAAQSRVFAPGFAFTKGQPRTFEWTSDAGNRRFGWFCNDCGSRIAHGQIPTAGVLSVRSGTLDDTSWVEPVGDIWTRSAQPWALLSSNRLRAEQQLTDYAPFIERFRRQGWFEF
ncbi:MAG TPA: GFA family protein [Candidatus Binatia bacterium]